MLYVLGEAVLRTALLAGILHSIFSLIRVRRIRLLLAAWTIVLATSLIMPLLLRSSPVRIPLDDAVPRVLFDSTTELMQQPLMQEPAGTASTETQVHLSIEAWLEIVYVVIASSLSLRVLIGVGLSLSILARAKQNCPEWALGLRVRLSREVAGPVTIARTIVLPADFDEWPTETQRAVIAHEHAHVARRDYAMLVVSQLNRALFWFSPVSWWLHRKLAVLAELVSDDQAIEVTRDRVGYAEILLEMAQRSGRAAQGPLMASFTTLPLRIDRILLDQVTSNQISRLQWATMTLGVAAASLIVANFIPSIALKPIVSDPSALSIRDVEIGKPIQEVSPSVFKLSAKALEPMEHVPSADPSITRTQQARMATRVRPTVPAPKKTTSNPPNIVAQQMIKTITSNDSQNRTATSNLLDDKRITVEGKNITTPVIPVDRQVTQRNEILYPRQMYDAPLHANFERLDGSTCVGTVAVGMAAYYQGGGLLEPNVKAGQMVPAIARFFRQRDGSSWVRFGSFGRPSLDVRVTPTRAGVTWTGEYGITYAVQEAGNSHLLGLAARVANDSALLSFTCKK